MSLVEQVQLGTSGLRVSRLALGCMSFGDPARGNTWALDDTAARPIFEAALEHGITFWDTANIYSNGTSEEVVGRAIATYTSRDQVVLATKAFFPMHEGPGGSGLSRIALIEQAEASLRRLNTDCIDLFQLHRYDPTVPVEETALALEQLVSSGKVRYVGACSMWAWQFAKLHLTAERLQTARFVSFQHQYSLLQRSAETDLFAMIADLGVGSLPWSPLARGLLSRPAGARTTRSADDPSIERFYGPGPHAVVDVVEQIARTHDTSMAQVALAWVLSNPVVTSPIVGATSARHIHDAVQALELRLSDDDLRALDASEPVRPLPF